MARRPGCDDDFARAMFTPSRNPLPIPVEVVLAPEFPPSETGLVHVGLRRPEQAGPALPAWKAVITVSAPVPLDPDSVLAQAHDFLVDDDRDGPVGVVDEITRSGADGDGTIVVACGWFGRHLLRLGFEDVVEILPAERRLVLRPGLPAVAEVRRRELSRVVRRIRALVDRPLLGPRRRRGPSR